MTGSYDIEVWNSRVKFKLHINRSITILRGESATGKTTLVSMIRNFAKHGYNSGICISSEVKCIVMDTFIQEYMHSHSIIFMDEDAEAMLSGQVQKAIDGMDAYVVIVTRDKIRVNELHKYAGLPVDICAVKRLRYSSKYVEDRYETIMESIYTGNKKRAPLDNFDTIVIEDEKSGYTFWKMVAELEDREIVVCTARSNSNVVNMALEYWKKGHSVLMVVDAAAYGCYMDTAEEVMEIGGSRLALLAPESFEYMLLVSDIIQGVKKDVLSKPEDYADSTKYKSIERFFTEYLVQITRGTPYEYSKSHLNSAYTSDSNISKIKRNFVE